MKTCGKCNKEQEPSEFHTDRRSKDGLMSTCKSCRKKHYQENRDDILAYKKEYAKNHIFNIMTTRQEYYERNKERLKVKSLKYYYASKEKTL